MVGDYVAFFPYNTEQSYFPFVEAKDNNTIELG